MFVTDFYCSSSSLIFNSLASILLFLYCRNFRTLQHPGSCSGQHFLSLWDPLSPPTISKWSSSQCNSAHLSYFIDIVSLQMFTVSSQELVAKWLCKGEHLCRNPSQENDYSSSWKHHRCVYIPRAKEPTWRELCLTAPLKSSASNRVSINERQEDDKTMC